MCGVYVVAVWHGQSHGYNASWFHGTDSSLWLTLLVISGAAGFILGMGNSAASGG
jgi:hypothetical protein